LAATRILKQESRTRHIPVVVLTAHAMREDEERSFEAGCNAFLTKPIEKKAFVDTLKRFVGTGKTAERETGFSPD
jgi:CheY-like chemotaxis protein